MPTFALVREITLHGIIFAHIKLLSKSVIIAEAKDTVLSTAITLTLLNITFSQNKWFDILMFNSLYRQQC